MFDSAAEKPVEYTYRELWIFFFTLVVILTRCDETKAVQFSHLIHCGTLAASPSYEEPRESRMHRIKLKAFSVRRFTPPLWWERVTMKAQRLSLGFVSLLLPENVTEAHTTVSFARRYLHRCLRCSECLWKNERFTSLCVPQINSACDKTFEAQRFAITQKWNPGFPSFASAWQPSPSL